MKFFKAEFTRHFTRYTRHLVRGESQLVPFNADYTFELRKVEQTSMGRNETTKEGNENEYICYLNKFQCPEKRKEEKRKEKDS